MTYVIACFYFMVGLAVWIAAGRPTASGRGSAFITRWWKIDRWELTLWKATLCR